MEKHMRIRRAIIAGGVLALYSACKKSLHIPSEDLNRNSKNGERIGADPMDQKDTSDTTIEAPSTQQPSNRVEPISGSLPLAGMMLALDVGHSLEGDDLGAFAKDISEHQLNTKEANRIAELLRAKGARVSVFYYKQSVALSDRGQDAGGHNVFLSIHHNAVHSPSVQGTEVLVNHPEHSAADQKLAQMIQTQLVAALWGSAPGVKDRGAKAQSLGVLRSTPSSVGAAALTEPFFITHSGLTRSQAEQMVETSAQAIAKGLERYWTETQTRTMSQSVEGDNRFTDADFTPWEQANDEFGLYADH
jgi:N-acetylmuramoyl-L-alanine amidase